MCLLDGRCCSGLGTERRPVRPVLKGSRVLSTFASLSEKRDNRNPAGTVSIIILCRLFDFKEMDAFFFLFSFLLFLLFLFFFFLFSFASQMCVVVVVFREVEDG